MREVELCGMNDRVGEVFFIAEGGGYSCFFSI